MTIHPAQIKAYKSMTPEQKLRISLRLYYSAKKLKASALRDQHPDWSEEEISKKVKEIFMHART
jgi:hypothetical protein